MALWVNEKGWSGYYARVLEAGNMTVGDKLELVERMDGNPTILEVNKARYWKEQTASAWPKFVTVRKQTLPYLVTRQRHFILLLYNLKY